MSKKVLANRNFLEQQVKLFLNEVGLQDAGAGSYNSADDARPTSGEILSGVAKVSYDALMTAAKSFVPVGNKIFRDLFYGSSMKQAMANLNYSESAGEKNIKDLKQVKQFFTFFKNNNLSKPMVDYTAYSTTKDLKRFLNRVVSPGGKLSGRIDVTNRETYNGSEYEKLYDWISYSNKTVPLDQKRIVSLIGSKQQLRKNGFFQKAARNRTDPRVFALLILTPLYNTLKNKNVLLSESSFETVLENYKEQFLLSVKSDDYFFTTMLSFLTASIVDPTGTHNLGSWWGVCNKIVNDKELNLEKASTNSLLKMIAATAVTWKLLKAEYKIIERGLKKVKLMPKGALAGLFVTIALYFAYSAIDPFGRFTKKISIPNVIKKTNDKIIEIYEKNYKQKEKWAFTADENNLWRQEYLNLLNIMNSEMETIVYNSPFSSREQKLLLLNLFTEISQSINTKTNVNINFKNFNEVKISLSKSYDDIVLQYNKISTGSPVGIVPTNVNEQKQKQERYTLSEQITDGFKRFGKSHGFKDIEARKTEIISMINAYMLKADSGHLERRLKTVRKITSKASLVNLEKSELNASYRRQVTVPLDQLKNLKGDQALTPLQKRMVFFTPDYLYYGLHKKLKLSGNLLGFRTYSMNAFYLPHLDRLIRNFAFIIAGNETNWEELAIKATDPNFNTSGQSSSTYFNLADDLRTSAAINLISPSTKTSLNDFTICEATYGKYYQQDSELNKLLTADDTDPDEKTFIAYMRAIIKIHQNFLFHFNKDESSDAKSAQGIVTNLFIRDRKLTNSMIQLNKSNNQKIEALPNWKNFDSKVKLSREEEDNIIMISAKSNKNIEKLAIEKMQVLEAISRVDQFLSNENINIEKLLKSEK